MYGDDSTLQTHAKDIKTVENKLTEILAKAAEWMKSNKLTLHLGKTEWMTNNKLTLPLGKTKVQLIGSYHCVTKNTKITVK